jgi:hypothetical protein
MSAIAGIAGQPLPGLWPIENWPDDFRMDQDQTLAGLLSYYTETAAVPRAEQMTPAGG